jgi:hypothetical protein
MSMNGVAMPCARYDTIQLGHLPAGAYTASYASYVARPDCAATNAVQWPGTDTTIVFTIGQVLATRRPAIDWHLSPTVLPATSAEIYLTATTVLRQVSIYDLAGREQARFDASRLKAQREGIALSIPHLAPALYLVRITGHDGQTSTQRFVRQ